MGECLKEKNRRMEENKKIAISGAGGFIGSFLNSYFTGRDYEVYPLHRDLFSPTRTEELKQVISSSDIIINLAGAPILHRWSSSYKKELMDSRVQTTRAIVNAIHEAGTKPSLLISASAVGYYATGACYDEYNARQGNNFLANVCEQWEKEALQASPEVRTVITRFGVIFAPHGGAFEKMAGPARLKISTILGPGTQALPWMSLRDLARAMDFLINNPQLSGVFNFTAPEQITYEDFAQQTAKQYNSFYTIHIPAKLIRLALGEGATFITENPCAIPTRLQEENFEYKDPDLKTFLNSL